jgi:type VII secretion integral membrane protein EccD
MAGGSAPSYTETARFCRVTVLAPRARMDLALPTDLTVAELVPMLCELTGEVGPRSRGQVRPSAWCLAAVAGAEMPPGGTLAALGVLDGDLLRLRRRAEAPPPPVFDDPVDAVAEAVPAADGTPGPWGYAGSSHGGEPLAVRPWDERSRRRAGLTAAVLVTALAAVLLAAARGPGAHAAPVAAVIAGLAALGALGAAAQAARLDPVAAVVLAGGSVPLAAACGFAAVPGTPGAGHVLLATALAAAAAAGALAVLDTPEPVLVGAVVASTVGALTALLGTFDAGPPAGLAAGAAAAAVGMLPMLPKISVRLAGLPAPVVPTTPEEMLAADAQWQLDSTADIHHQSRLAHLYLGGLVIGASVVAGVGAALAAATGGTGGAVFAAVVVAVLLLRTRCYATSLASGAPLVAGLATGTVLVAGVATRVATGLAGGTASTDPGLLGLGVGLGLLAAATGTVALVRHGERREPSPVARRAVDIVEGILVVATFPLALWVLDLYRAVQGL